MGHPHRNRLPLNEFNLPGEVPTLGPDWVACLTVYWRGQPPRVAREILRQVETAMYEPAPERSVYQLQQALRQLGLVEIQIIRLVLTQHRTFVQLNAPYPAQQIAMQVLATLLRIEEDRRRGRLRPTGS